ncbi:MAG: hypothetical protein E7589_06840 [Ruminococcaceae bacterium]|nr:hypothetical protein [Oscillospiraceae bacterium]
MADLKKSHSNLVNALIYIVLGVLFCAFRSGMLAISLYIGGGVFIILGILDMLKKEYVSGAVSAVIGIVLILFGAFNLLNIVLFVLGIMLVIKGAVSLIEAIKGKSVVDIVFAAITVTAGILLMVSNLVWAVIDIFLIIIGVILIVNGVIELVGKELKKLIKK